MKSRNLLSVVFLRPALLGVLALAVPSTRAGNTDWTGPAITFTHDAFSSEVDMLTTNHTGADAVNNVWLTRGTSHPLYNAAAEGAWNGSTSPVNTLWAAASGDLTDAASLSYDTFDNVVGQPGHSPGLSVGQTFYVWIVSDNIYLALTLTEWGNNDGGGFSYMRTTPATAAPAVSITNPASGAVFAAPASLKLAATASVDGGTVTNVEFFANSVSQGSVTTAPFNVVTGNLSAGSYALTAVATAAGLSATSAVVNVTVVNPATVVISNPAQSSTATFQFNYSANTGLSYLVQRSANLLSTNWLTLVTNTAAGNSVNFADTNATANRGYYRVGRLPNP